jgi:Enoyl-CoA hydratase/isomerase
VTDVVRLVADDLDAIAASPVLAQNLTAAHGVSAVVFPGATVANPRSIALINTVVIALGDGPMTTAADVVAADADDLHSITATVERAPLASFALTRLTRQTERLGVADGLAAESAVYSMLQAGPEFATWRAANPARPVVPLDHPPVLVDRDHDTLLLTLNRPERHNAFDPSMRDALYDALLLAASDPTIGRTVLRGNGPSFCSGGDLDTFGTSPDPATAHAIRLARSVGALIAELDLEVHLHGACLGAGIELAAFARHVTAAPDTVIGLPELALGLVPGAGGTVSLTHRIGRPRTNWLALTNARITADTALAWGLVDAIA